MKILFLDIDGVCNTDSTENYIYVYLGGESRRMKAVDNHLIELVGKIVRATECKVVLHSTWRNFDDPFRYLQAKLYEVGVEIHEKTICLGGTRSSQYKKEEIWDYLENHGTDAKYAVLDDDPSVNCEGFADRFFQPGKDGLTPEMADQIIEYLNQ